MLDRLGRTSLELLVATAVLAWTSMPPAIVHSHSDGEDPAHRHEVCAQHHDHHHHHDSSHAANHVHERPATLGLVESRTSAIHCHWQLLGFWFALPFSGDPNGGEDEGGMAKVAIVDLADGDGLAAPTTIALAQAICQPGPAASPAVVPSAPTLQTPQRQTISIPLCDSARLERSGVLLV